MTAPPLAAASSSPRERLIASLSDAVRDAALVGDTQALLVASDALQRLVSGGSVSATVVVDLAARRRER